MSKRRPMNPQTKRNLANGFGSLISNARAVDAGKELPIWLAAIFFVLSAFIPTIPTLVTASKTYGSEFVATTNYGMDTSLYEVTKDMEKSKVDYKIINNELLAYKDGSQYTGDDIEWDHINQTSSQVQLRAIYTNKTGDKFKELYTAIAKQEFTVGTVNPKVAEVEGATYYIPSFLVLSPKDMVMGVFKISSTTGASSSYSGISYEAVSVKDNMMAELFAKGITGDVSADRQTVFKNWCKFFDETYYTQKGVTMGVQTGIFCGVYAGLNLLMGLLVFLLTRGKNNIFRYLSFLTTQKISAFASLSPAILALILGFIIPKFAQMFYILFMGLRIMWLTMKQLKPQAIN